MLAKNYHLHWIAGRAYILCKCFIYVFCQFWGVAFAVPFLCHFQNLKLLVTKTFWVKFCGIALLLLLFHYSIIFYYFCMISKSVSQIFKIFFQTRNMNIFVFRGVFFSRYVQHKSPFSDEKKHQRWNLRDTYVEKLLKFDVSKY